MRDRRDERQARREGQHDEAAKYLPYLVVHRDSGRVESACLIWARREASTTLTGSGKSSTGGGLGGNFDTPSASATKLTWPIFSPSSASSLATEKEHVVGCDACTANNVA